MIRTRALVVVACVVALSSLLAWASPTLRPPRAKVPAGATPSRTAQVFTHRSHLPEDFRDRPAAELNSLCARCHAFEAGGAEEYLKPLRLCYDCHVPVPAGTPDATVDRLRSSLFRMEYEPPRSPSGELFNHSTVAHRGIRCTECHALSPSGEVQFASGLKLSNCSSMKCHSDHNPRPGDASPGVRALNAALQPSAGQPACASCHVKGSLPMPDQRTAAGRFRHVDHMRPAPGGWEKAACASCHPNVASLDQMDAENYAQFFLPESLTGSCGQCHRTTEGSGSAPLTTRLAAADTIRRGMSNFSHALHANSSDPALAQSCQTAGCHAPDPRGEPSLETLYRGCIVCHADRAVENHGAASDCNRCHSPTEEHTSGVMRKESVRRVHDPRFLTDGHLHPGITRGGPENRIDANECSACHRSPREALVREAARPFSHYWHVGEQPTTAACLACHHQLKQSQSSLNTHPLAEVGLIHPEDCGRCHIGTSFESSGETRVREVAAFSHADHLHEGARWETPEGLRRALDCSDCHAPDGQESYRTLPGAADCRMCHGHQEPRKAAISGRGSETQDRGRCVSCHQVDERLQRGHTERLQNGATVWVANRFEVERFRAEIDAQKQHHDQRGGCAVCHDMEQHQQMLIPSRVTVVSKASPHSAAVETQFVANGSRDCSQCHARQPYRRSNLNALR